VKRKGATPIASFLARFQVDRESTNLPIRVIWRHFLGEKCRSEGCRYVRI